MPGGGRGPAAATCGRRTRRRLPRRRSRRRRRYVGEHRHHPDVRARAGRADRLADPGGARSSLVLGIVLRGTHDPDRPARARADRWGRWLLVTGLMFSFMAGIFHAYYTVALAPAVARAGGRRLGARMAAARRCSGCAWFGAATLLATAATAWMLLSRSPTSCRGCAGRCWSSASSRRSAAGARADRAGLPPSSIGCGVAHGPRRARRLRGRHDRDPAHRLDRLRRPERRGARGGLGGMGGGRGGRTVRGDGRAAPTAGGARRHGRAVPGADGARPAARRAHRRTGGVGMPGGGRPRRLLNGSEPSAELTALLEQDADRLHLGGGDHRLQQRLRLPAGHRAAGDADRRLQRQRPVADAGASSSSTWPRARSTTSSAAAAWAASRAEGTSHRDHRVGGAELHRRTRSTGSRLYDLTSPVS